MLHRINIYIPVSMREALKKLASQMSRATKGKIKFSELMRRGSDIMLSLSLQSHIALEKLSKSMGMKVSEIIKMAVEDFLKKHKES